MNDSDEQDQLIHDIPRNHKSGYVAIIGKPNAGKSTLLNAIVGSKLSITTNKPQTTRHRVIGIYSKPETQIIFIDTPGMIHPKYKLQEAMMRNVATARQDADIIVYVVDATDKIPPEETFEKLKQLHKPVILVINKMDLVSSTAILPLIDELSHVYPFDLILPVSALKKEGLDKLVEALLDRLPYGPPFYPKDMISEHPERFFVAELIREQIFKQFQQEIPYSCAVNIVQYEESKKIDHIDAEIVVNRDSQKGILIGKKGSALKKLGTAARKSIEEFIGKKIFLNLHVKVRSKWRDKDTFIRNYGYK
jgi:GTP-binding protein Era